jgi:hypothetical protein
MIPCPTWMGLETRPYTSFAEVFQDCFGLRLGYHCGEGRDVRLLYCLQAAKVFQ